MTASRPYVLGDVSALPTPPATVLLVGVPATVFFTVTVAYLLVPLRRRLEARRTFRWVASLAAIVVAVVGVGVVLAPLVVIFSFRLSDILELAVLPPDVATIGFLGMVETVTLDDVVAVGLDLLQSVGHTITTAAPVVLIKLTLFGFLVLMPLLNGDAVGQTFPALVPAGYRSATTVFNERAHETLFAIYALQAATVIDMFAIGLIVFWALGCDYTVTLAIVAAVLQPIPIVGPSVLLATMAACHAAAGGVVAAVLVIALLVEPADLLGAKLHVDDVGGDGDERDELADDPVDPSQP